MSFGLSFIFTIIFIFIINILILFIFYYLFVYNGLKKATIISNGYKNITMGYHQVLSLHILFSGKTDQFPALVPRENKVGNRIHLCQNRVNKYPYTSEAWT